MTTLISPVHEFMKVDTLQFEDWKCVHCKFLARALSIDVPDPPTKLQSHKNRQVPQSQRVGISTSTGGRMKLPSAKGVANTQSQEHINQALTAGWRELMMLVFYVFDLPY